MFNLNTSKIVEIGSRWSMGDRGVSRPPVAGIAAAGEAETPAGPSSDEGRRPERAKPVQPGGDAHFEPPPPLFLRRYGVVEGTFKSYLDIVLRPRQDFAFRVYGPSEAVSADAAQSAYADGGRIGAEAPRFATVA